MIKNLAICFAILAASALPARAQFSDQQSYAGASTGSANTYNISIPNVGALADILGVHVRFIPNFSNTGASTLVVNGIGGQPIKKAGTSGPIALSGVSGEIVVNQLVDIIWDGTEFLIDSVTNASPAATIPTPQGYLTPCPSTSPPAGCTAGQIIPTGDVSAATALYYTPYNGNQIPIYNGTVFVVQTFAEIQMTLGGSHLANTIYDICVTTTAGGVYSALGTPTLVTGPAWTTSTAGSGARGSGAGTPQIAKLQGIWTNAVSMSGINGGSSYTIPANSCTYVASIQIDSSNGQVSFNIAYGQSRKWAAWNAYNRQQIRLKAGDPTGSWVYNTATYRAANANAANNVTIFAGLPEEQFDLELVEQVNAAYSGPAPQGFVAIGYNSTTTASGKAGSVTVSATNPVTIQTDGVAKFLAPPAIGVNTITAIEKGNGTGTTTFNGSEPSMILSAQWRG